MRLNILALLFIACGTNAEDLARRFKEVYVEGTYSVDSSRDREYNSIGFSEIGIQRRGGFCSKARQTRCTYSFVVKIDGTVSYQRIYPASIEHHGHLNTSYLVRLLELIDESNFFFMEDAYTYGIDHCSTTYTKVIREGREKIIRNFCDSGPATLWAIKKAIDELKDYVIWIDPNFTPIVAINCTRNGSNFLELTEGSIKASFVKEGEAGNLQHSFESQEGGSIPESHQWTWGPTIDPPVPHGNRTKRYVMTMKKMDSEGWFSGTYHDYYGKTIALPFAFSCRGTASKSQKNNKPWLNE